MIRNVKIELLGLASRMSAQLSSTVQFPNTADHRPYTLIKPAILDYTVRVIKALSLSDSWFQWAANRIARFYRDQWQNVVFWRGEREGKRWVDFALRFFCFAILNTLKRNELLFSTHFFILANMLNDIAYRYEKWPSLFLLPRHPFGELQPVMQEINKTATYLLPYV